MDSHAPNRNSRASFTLNLLGALQLCASRLSRWSVSQIAPVKMDQSLCPTVCWLFNRSWVHLWEHFKHWHLQSFLCILVHLLNLDGPQQSLITCFLLNEVNLPHNACNVCPPANPSTGTASRINTNSSFSSLLACQCTDPLRKTHCHYKSISSTILWKQWSLLLLVE